MITNKVLKEHLENGGMNDALAEAIYEMAQRYFIKSANFAGQYWRHDMCSHAVVETLNWVHQNFETCKGTLNPYSLIMSKLREFALEFSKKEQQ